MQVAVFSICHNEAAFLPYFFKHYRSFTDYIAILDNNSTDGSLKICEQESDHVESINTDNLHRIDVMTSLKNNYWKSLKNFDWVFIVDIDEIVYHNNMIGFLEKSRGYTVLKPTAYQMICDTFPIGEGQITEIMPFGILSTPVVSEALLCCDSFNKKCIISPKDIIETNYSNGAHYARMIGKVVESCDPNLKLLHYRFLGLDYLLNKNKMRAERLIPKSVAGGSSCHYLKSEEQLTNAFQKALIERVNVCKMKSGI